MATLPTKFVPSNDDHLSRFNPAYAQSRSGRTMRLFSQRATRYPSWWSHPSAQSTLTSRTVQSMYSQPRLLRSPPSRRHLSFLSRIPIEHRPKLEACLVRGIRYPPSQEIKNDQCCIATTGQTKLAAVEQVQVMITPAGLEGVYNPSFDVTPAELITAVATEKGVATRSEGERVVDLSGVV